MNSSIVPVQHMPSNWDTLENQHHKYADIYIINIILFICKFSVIRYHKCVRLTLTLLKNPKIHTEGLNSLSVDENGFN